MVYRLDREDNRLVELEETTFADEKVTEPMHIEEWVRKNPKLLCDEGEEIKVVSKQQTYESGTRSDLVAVDNLGQIVIVELKRDIAEPMTEFQAIRYTSSYLYSTYDEICQIYARYLEQNRAEFGIDEGQDLLGEARKEIENLCSGIKLPEDFNKNQRIVLVAKEFSQDLRSAVTWLILKGINIKCIALAPYSYNEELLVVPQVILPTPEISENIVRVRQAEDKVKQERQRVAYQIWEGSIDDHYSRLNPPLGEDLRRVVSELGIEPSRVSGGSFHLAKEDRKIIVSTWAKSKVEFRFPKSTKGDLESVLQDLGVTSLTVKEKADIEPYGLGRPTPSIDYREEAAAVEDIVTVSKSWLRIK